MSWKDLKVAKKLYVGFGIVLMLALAIGYVGYNGLNTVAENTANLDDADLMNAYVKDAATLRQKFFAERDAGLLSDVKEVIQTIRSKSRETQARLQDPAAVKLIDECNNYLDEYESGWEEVAQGQLDIEAAIVKMDEAAATSSNAVDALVASQKKALASELSSSVGTSALKERVTKLNNSQDLVNYVASARINYRDFRRTEDDRYAQNLNEAIDALVKRAEETRDMMSRQIDIDELTNIIAAAEKYRQNFNDVVDLKHKAAQDAQQLAAVAGKVVENFTELRQGQNEKRQAAQASAITLAVAFVIGAILIGVFVAFFIARGISRPVSEMARAAEEIAVGDINQNIELQSRDEIGTLAASFRQLIDYMKELSGHAEAIADNDLTITVQPKSDRDTLGHAFRTMVHNLSGIIRQLTENATQLVSAATEISSSSEQMSKGAQDQAGQVNQVSTAIEEMTATILQSSKNAGEAKETAEGASGTATSGGQVVNDTIQGMQRIAGVVRESAESIGKLAKSADQIGEIIGVIDDIADQTNLLALNAAIEAARAGEQGRGFAVVADEVRKLAERTGKATGEITDMIKGIQTETNDAVGSMETGIQEVDKGRELADQAGNSLTEIVNMSQRVMDMIQQIATASEEQSTAAEQISKNIEHISSVTKESASGAEQSAAAAEELSRQADGLQAMVARFRINNDGGSQETTSEHKEEQQPAEASA
jgi:methyl-accepting chemotaxis protein